MKKLITIVLFLMSVQIYGQTYSITAISISSPANLDANTANWGTGTSSITILATTPLVAGKIDGRVTECKLLLQIKKGGVKVCGSYLSSTAPAANFNTATKIWSGSSAVALLGQNCVLAPGDYEICAQFFGAGSVGPTAISEEKCKSFTIRSTVPTNYQRPQNISPANETVFNETVLLKPHTFRWTKVVPEYASPITYRVKAWQITPGQNPSQAISQNTPLLNSAVVNAIQLTVPKFMAEPCTYPMQCSFVWTVQALSAAGLPIGDNNGTSEMTIFSTEKRNLTNPSDPSTTTSAGCSSVSTKLFVSGDVIGLSNDFVMRFTATPTGTNDSLSGEGAVYVKWLGLLKVQFNGIKINASDKLCAGIIYTVTDSNQVYPTQFAINTMGHTSLGSWTDAKVQNVCASIKANNASGKQVQAANMVDSILNFTPLKMPIGYFKANDTTTEIGFTEMMFTPNHAEFELIASLPTKEIFKTAYNNGTKVIALQGKGIEFTKSGLTGINGSIKILDSISFLLASGGEYLKLTFNKETNGHLGNGIVFSATNNEFWKYNLDLDIELPKAWLVPVDHAKSNVSMNFQMAISQWDDFILEGNLPACIIPQSNGVGIEASLITFDHSSISNVSGMVFPAGYGGNTNNFFSGFYLKNFKLTLPDQLRSYADTSKKVQVIAENLIIDEYGLSGKIVANNVLTYPKANIGNLGASIDTVKVSFANSVLTEAVMLGKITLPLSSTDNISNAINYSAMFSGGLSTNGLEDNSTIVFALKPQGDIKSKFLGDGSLQINQTSSLNLTLSKTSANGREIALAVNLNGKLYYPMGNIIDPGSTIPLDLDLSCNFENLGLSYTKNATENFTLNTGHWSFASPQKKLAGFAFTITDVKPKINPIGTGTQAAYLFSGGVEFVAKINIGSENSKIGISGDTKIALTGAIESAKYTAPSSSGSTTGIQNLNILTSQSQVLANKNSTSPSVIASSVSSDWGFLTHLKPIYLGVTVESIHIDAHMPALTIKGSVEFYKHDPVYGNGFKGELEAKFTTIEMRIQAGAIFGNTKYIPGNVGNGYKYWMVQAQANLPPPGIVFLTGVAFRGFGAGVYSRMRMTPPATFDPTAANGSTFGGAIFTPCDTISMGFKVKAIIATTPKEETFNGSVALSAEFNSNGGMNFIEIDGLFNCGAKIGHESEAFANGNIIVKYDFPAKIFDMTSQLIINKNPLSTDATGIQTKFHIDGLQNKWFFMSGTPTLPNKIYLFGVGINSYLMFGNDIEIPQGFMQETKDGFASIGHYPLPNFNDNATGEGQYQSAKGFAFGLGINYNKSDSYNLADWQLCNSCTHRYLTISYGVSAGVELDASLLQYAGCTGFGSGWRIKASLAMYAGASIDYSYNLPIFQTGSGLLAKVDGSAYATVEFPNPTFFKGELNGDFSIADYSVPFHKSFLNGSQCAGTPVAVDPGINQNVYNQENVTDSLSYSLIKEILDPSNNSSVVSRTTKFSVLLNYPFNEAFDLQEQQSSGQMKVRTFRVLYSTKLTQDSANNNSNTGGIVTLKNATINKANSGVNLTAGNNSNISSSIASPLNLIDGGFDAMGAKLFRLGALVNSNPATVAANALKMNTSYKFEIKAALQEKINNSWQAVNHKNSNSAIKETKSIYFKTNSDPVSSGLASGTGAAKSIIH